MKIGLMLRAVGLLRRCAKALESIAESQRNQSQPFLVHKRPKVAEVFTANAGTMNELYDEETAWRPPR